VRITVDIGRPRWLPRLPRWVWAAMVGVVLAAVPGALMASHQFGDVPDAQPFHDEIGAIKDAGITSGCGGGNYCPTQNVRRDAMAAFMHRGFGRVAQVDYVVDVSADVIEPNAYPGEVIAEVTITVPGTGAGATQFVDVFGKFTASADDALLGNNCPCDLVAFIFDVDDPVLSLSLGSDFRLNNATKDVTTVSDRWVLPATPGPHTYALAIWNDDAVSTTSIEVSYPVVIATTYPFGSTGGNTLSAERDVPRDAARESR